MINYNYYCYNKLYLLLLSFDLYLESYWSFFTDSLALQSQLYKQLQQTHQVILQLSFSLKICSYIGVGIDDSKTTVPEDEE